VDALYQIPHLGPLLRTWRGRLIVAVVATQLLIPLRYYVANRDPHDERFAWRMFSPMRMAQCTPDMRVDGKKLELGTEFHEAWVEIAKRGRFVVVEGMAAKLCRKQPGVKVTVTLECRYLGKPEPEVYGGFDLCEVPEI
jgi:hypothetical protein